MRGRARRVGVAIVLAAVMALASSCSSTPKTVGPCHHVVAYPHDGGFVAAYDWDDNIHTYGEPVPLTVCIGGIGGDVVTLATPAGVVPDPTAPQRSLGGVDVFTFDVTVSPGGQGELRLRVREVSGAVTAEAFGPVITPSGEGWRFTDPDLS